MSRIPYMSHVLNLQLFTGSQRIRPGDAKLSYSATVTMCSKSYFQHFKTASQCHLQTNVNKPNIAKQNSVNHEVMVCNGLQVL